MSEHHNNNNPQCPLNDPETFANPATRGLQCTCPPDEADASNQSQPEPLQCAQPGCNAIHPNATSQSPGSQAGWRCKQHELPVMNMQTIQSMHSRLTALEKAAEDAPTADAIKRLAQAALDLVVGFRIRARGSVVQLGVLERMVVVHDLETAKAVEHIIGQAALLGCQGIDLVTPFDVNDDPPAGGIFGPPAVEVTNSVLEGQTEGRDREAFDQGVPRAPKPPRA